MSIILCGLFLLISMVHASEVTAVVDVLTLTDQALVPRCNKQAKNSQQQNACVETVQQLRQAKAEASAEHKGIYSVRACTQAKILGQNQAMRQESLCVQKAKEHMQKMSEMIHSAWEKTLHRADLHQKLQQPELVTVLKKAAANLETEWKVNQVNLQRFNEVQGNLHEAEDLLKSVYGEYSSEQVDATSNVRAAFSNIVQVHALGRDPTSNMMKNFYRNVETLNNKMPQQNEISKNLYLHYQAKVKEARTSQSPFFGGLSTSASDHVAALDAAAAYLSSLSGGMSRVPPELMQDLKEIQSGLRKRDNIPLSDTQGSADTNNAHSIKASHAQEQEFPKSKADNSDEQNSPTANLKQDSEWWQDNNMRTLISRGTAQQSQRKKIHREPSIQQDDADLFQSVRSKINQYINLPPKKN